MISKPILEDIKVERLPSPTVVIAVIGVALILIPMMVQAKRWLKNRKDIKRARELRETMKHTGTDQRDLGIPSDEGAVVVTNETTASTPTSNGTERPKKELDKRNTTLNRTVRPPQSDSPTPWKKNTPNGAPQTAAESIPENQEKPAPTASAAPITPAVQVPSETPAPAPEQPAAQASRPQQPSPTPTPQSTSDMPQQQLQKIVLEFEFRKGIIQGVPYRFGRYCPNGQFCHFDLVDDDPQKGIVLGLPVNEAYPGLLEAVEKIEEWNAERDQNEERIKALRKQRENAAREGITLVVNELSLRTLETAPREFNVIPPEMLCKWVTYQEAQGITELRGHRSA